MLVRMLYVSCALGPITTAVTGTILRTAQAYNASNGITGVLCQDQQSYLQVLEGERSKVGALYARIALDKRHHNVSLRQTEDITRRRYGRWSMAHVDLAGLNGARGALDPALAGMNLYTTPIEQILAKIDALIVAGKVMDMPVV